MQPDAAIRLAPARAIFQVALNAQALTRKLRPNLVVATAQKFYLQKEVALAASHNPVAHKRLLASRTSLSIGDAFVMFKASLDIMQQFAFRRYRRQRLFNNSPVTFFNQTRGKRRVQEGACLWHPRKEAAPRHRHIKPMYRDQLVAASMPRKQARQVHSPVPRSFHSLAGQFVYHNAGITLINDSFANTIHPVTIAVGCLYVSREERPPASLTTTRSRTTMAQEEQAMSYPLRIEETEESAYTHADYPRETPHENSSFILIYP